MTRFNKFGLTITNCIGKLSEGGLTYEGKKAIFSDEIWSAQDMEMLLTLFYLNRNVVIQVLLALKVSIVPLAFRFNP
jgi:hypothetical protein